MPKKSKKRSAKERAKDDALVEAAEKAAAQREALGLYYGYYIPGPNDHGDRVGEVLFANIEEVASLFQVDVGELSRIDFGRGSMIVRTDMQLDNGAPLNPVATRLLAIRTELGLAIRGPACTFVRGKAPDLPALN
jgi:hypothetical protein